MKNLFLLTALIAASISVNAQVQTVTPSSIKNKL